MCGENYLTSEPINIIMWEVMINNICLTSVCPEINSGGTN
jgi:hypothetical protein